MLKNSNLFYVCKKTSFAVLFMLLTFKTNMSDLITILITSVITGLLGNNSTTTAIADAKDIVLSSFQPIAFIYILYSMFKMNRFVGLFKNRYHLQMDRNHVHTPEKAPASTATTNVSETPKDLVPITAPINNEQEVSVNVTDNKDPISVESSSGNVVDNAAASAQINPYMIQHHESTTRDFESQIMKIRSVDWTAAAAAGSTLATVTWQTLATQPIILRLGSLYHYFRSDIKISVSIQGNAMSQGSLCGGHRPHTPFGSNLYPNGTSAASQPLPANPLAAQYQLPHMIIDSSISGRYEFLIPYTHNSEWVPLKGATCLTSDTNFNYSVDPDTVNWFYWNLLVAAIYRPPTSLTTGIRVDIYAQLVNLEYCCPKPQNYVAAPTLENFSIPEPAVSSPYRHQNTWEATTRESFTRQGLIEIGNTTNTCVMMDHINNSNLPTEVKNDAITANVPASLAYDNPSDPTNPPEVLHSSYQKFTYDANVINVVKFSAQPSKLYTLTEKDVKNYRLMKDETSIKFFEHRRSYERVVNVPSSTAAGAAMTQMKVQLPNPNLMQYSITGTVAPNSIGSFNISSFMDVLNSIRGFTADMHVHIRFHTNNFINHKVLFAYFPVPLKTYAALDAANSTDPRSFPHYVHDVSLNDKEVTITIPYHEYHRTMQCTNKTRELRTFCCGTVGMWSLTGVSSSNATPSTYDFTISYSLSNLKLSNHCPLPFYYRQIAIRAMNPTPYFNQSRFATFNSLKSLIIPPVFYHQASLFTPTVPDNAALNFNNMCTEICLDEGLIAYDWAWNCIRTMYTGYKGGMRYIITVESEAPQASPLHVLLQLNYSTPQLNSDRVLGTRLQQCNMYNTVPDPQLTYGLPKAASPPLLIDTPQVGIRYSGGMTGRSGHQYMLDTHVNTQCVIEVPYHYEGLIYAPFVANVTEDRLRAIAQSENTPRLLISLLNGARRGADKHAAVLVTVQAQPADDFQPLHYKGGPTNKAIIPVSNVTAAASVNCNPTYL